MIKYITILILLSFSCQVLSQYSNCFQDLIEKEEVQNAISPYDVLLSDYPSDLMMESYGDWVYTEVLYNKALNLSQSDSTCIMEQLYDLYITSQSCSTKACCFYGDLLLFYNNNDDYFKLKYYYDEIFNLVQENQEMIDPKTAIDIYLHLTKTRLNDYLIKTNNADTFDDKNFNLDNLIYLKYKYHTYEQLSNDGDTSFQSELKLIVNQIDSSSLTTKNYEYCMNLMTLYLANQINHIFECLITKGYNELQFENFRKYAKDSLMLTKPSKSDHLSSSIYHYIHSLNRLKNLAPLFKEILSKNEVIQFGIDYCSIVPVIFGMEDSNILIQKLSYYQNKDGLPSHIASQAYLGLDILNKFRVSNLDLSRTFNLNNIYNTVIDLSSSLEVSCNELTGIHSFLEYFIQSNQIGFDSICLIKNELSFLLSNCPLNNRLIENWLKSNCVSSHNSDIIISRLESAESVSYNFTFKEDETQISISLQEEQQIIDRYTSSFIIDSAIIEPIYSLTASVNDVNIYTDGLYNIIDVRFYKDTNDYLFEKKRITYLANKSNSPEEMKALSDSTYDYIGYGGFTFGDTLLTSGFGALSYRDTRFTYLPESETEIIEASKYFQNQKVILGSSGIETSFYNNTDSRVIHIATHATIADPLNPGLVFLQDDTNDGILYASEIKELDLSNTDVVILSACNSGVVKKIDEEFNQTLAAAFISAGAKHVIFTKDKVVDFYAKEFSSKLLKYYTINPNISQAYERTLKEMNIEYSENIQKWAIFNFVTSNTNNHDN